jgi:3-hydroxymyristoyl/3-hydroxydecanoyl-(acyl carrier protein) dehydratase
MIPMPATALDTADSLLDLDATFLPVAQMRQISRVTAIDGPRISAVVDVGPDHWVYPQHFPRDPIFPGTLIIEAAGQLVALWAWTNGHRGRPRLVRASASFYQPVTRPTPGFALHAEVRGKRHLAFGTVEVLAGGSRVARVEVVLAVLPQT